METDPSGVAPREAADPLILAIDAGSSSVRALGYDARGRRVEGWEAHHPYTATTTLDGGVTADPDTLVHLIAACIDEVLPKIAMAGREVAAVACDTFWHSLIAVGEDGQALTPVLTWADTRSSGAAVELRRRLDEKAVHARTGAGIHSSYWPAKLLWLQQTDESVLRRAHSVQSFGEFLYQQLFGERRVSLSMASGTGLFDQNRCTWDDELLAVLPIRREQLSPLADYDESFTRLAEPYAHRWPHLQGVPWYLALGDGGCNNIGSGGCNENWIVVMVGTSGALRVVRAADRVKVPEGLWTYRVDRRRFVQGGALSAGGNVWAWLLQTLQLPPAASLEEQLLQLPPDGHGLTVLPFLAGERSPDWNPDAVSAFVGATLNTRPCDFVQASLEAVTYRFALVHAILRRDVPPAKGIIGSGVGLIHSPAWMQMMTDVLAEPMVTSSVPEATSRGAALLVLEALGAIPSIGDAEVPLGRRYEPNPAHVHIYQQAIRRQENLYARLLGPEHTTPG